MTPEETIAFVRANGLTDDPDLPVLEQLDEQAGSMTWWAVFNYVVFCIPLFGWKYLSIGWSVLIGAIFFGKASMYLYEAKRLREAVDCFERFDVETLAEMDSLPPSTNRQSEPQ